MMEADCRKNSKSLFQQVVAGEGSVRRSGPGLRMTPMIDVIFLLLAFFVITARFREPEGFLPVQLPSPDSVPAAGRIVEPLIVEISGHERGCLAELSGGQTIVLTEAMPEKGLAALAAALDRVCRAQQRTSEDPIELICHNEVTWDFVVKIYEIVQAMGARNITFVTTEESHE